MALPRSRWNSDLRVDSLRFLLAAVVSAVLILAYIVSLPSDGVGFWQRIRELALLCLPNALTMLLVFCVLHLVFRSGGITPEQRILDAIVQLSHVNTIEIHPGHTDAMYRIIEIIRASSPKKAKIIAYSTDSIEPVVSELLARNCSLSILMKDPEHAISEMQKNRINGRIVEITQAQDSQRHLSMIRGYCAPASLSGIKIDDSIIALSWYTYPPSDMPHERSFIRGHDNAVIIASLDCPEGKALSVMFDRSFEWLSGTAASVDLKSDVYPL